MQNKDNISPDGKWKVVLQNNRLEWFGLTQQQKQFTIKEIVEATKNIDPTIWKK
jgi:hypothetical protein